MDGENRIKFELRRLLAYDDADLVAELRRVAALITEPVLTKVAYDALARAKSSTVARRFGGWREALTAAGLQHRYGGQSISEKMRSQPARAMSDDEVLEELRRVARSLETDTLSRDQLNGHSEAINYNVVARRFGSWRDGLAAAGLGLPRHGRRHSEDEYFENLLTVWTRLGRPPKYREMDEPPSTIDGHAYQRRWRRWSLALHAFVQRMNADLADAGETPSTSVAPQDHAQAEPPAPRRPEDRQEIRIGLRYAVLSRDRFRCVLCGASPATDLRCRLHVDHVVPFSKGGKTVIANLRTLCEPCNVGRGNRE